MSRIAMLYVVSFIVMAVAAGEETQERTLADGWNDSLWVSPDGKMALFMYSRYNFFPLLLGKGQPVLRGADRPGHHNNDANVWEDSDLYIVIRGSDGKWSEPINMPTNDGGGDCCAMIAGADMYFQKGTDLYRTSYKDEKWTAAAKLPVCSDKIDSNPHYDWTTNTLYWASDRGGNMDIWCSHRDEAEGKEVWSTPKPVAGALNTPAKEDQPFVIGDTMRFSRSDESGNLVSKRDKDGKWSKGEIENLGTAWYHSEVSMSQDGKMIRFVAADLGTQRLVFMQSQRQADGRWGAAKPFLLE
jgi:hypothetical protein